MVPLAKDVVTPLLVLRAPMEKTTAPVTMSHTPTTMVKTQNIVLNISNCEPDTDTRLFVRFVSEASRNVSADSITPGEN